MKIFVVIFLLVNCINSLPTPSDAEVKKSDEEKGILDGMGGTTTAAPGLGGLGSVL